MEGDENKVYNSMLPYDETMNRTAYNLDISYFTLRDVIEFLEDCDPNQVLPLGFYNPHSYRGSYYDLAFEPVRDITIHEMLNACKWALGKEFQGYKGGWFKMDEGTDCWIAYEGHGGGEKIGKILLMYMTEKVADLG